MKIEKKGDMMWSTIVIVMISIAVLITLTIFAFLSSSKGISILSFVKDIFRYGG